MYFAGYSVPSMQGLEAAPTAMLASKVDRRDHETCVDMAHAVEAGEIDPSVAGCNGLSPLVEHIPEFDSVNSY